MLLQLASGSSPDDAWSQVAKLCQTAASSQQTCSPKASAPAPLANGDAHDSDSNLPQHLDSAIRQALASASASVSGAWGTQNFGLADAGVLMRLEALPGVELCEGYVLTEQRGGWEQARKRLEKEAQKWQKAADKVRAVYMYMHLDDSSVAGFVHHHG